MLFLAPLLLAGCVDAAEAGRLPEDVKPDRLITLCPQDQIRFLRWGPLDDGIKRRSLVIVRKNGTVIVRAGSYAGGFQISDTQRTDLTGVLESFSEKRLTARRYQEPQPPSAQGGMDVYLSVRRGNRVFSWSNTRYEHPGIMPLFDVLEVYAYLARTPDPPPAPELPGTVVPSVPTEAIAARVQPEAAPPVAAEAIEARPPSEDAKLPARSYASGGSQDKTTGNVTSSSTE